MNLTALLNNVSNLECLTPEQLQAKGEQSVLGVTSDSREVKPGMIFVALLGSHTDGHQYVAKAAELGALAIVISAERQDKVTLPASTPVFKTNNTYRALGELCSAFYGHPGQQLKMIGVTGTNGKTTVTHLIETMITDWGKTVGLIGTLGQKRVAKKADASDAKNEAYESTGHTTPMAPELQAILASMRDTSQEYVVMEVSSHALEQDRAFGCDFRVAVLTNITQDHLDYHKTMDNYWKAKALLFQNLTPTEPDPRYAVVNLDTDYASEFVKACPNLATVYTYSLENPQAKVYAKNMQYSITGASFTVVTPHGESPVNLKIAGKFSVYNALAALAAGLALGIPLAQCVKSVESVRGIRGRFEVVSENPYVIVDYAHTPDGLENILSAARLVTPKEGRLIAVFGCGGDRDATKRPKMGKIATDLADIAVITSDNPRSEDPQQIITDIMSGIARFDTKRMFVNADRKEAIHSAIDMATPHDLIVVAGKGHEDYQILADRTIHFDDREVVQDYMKSRHTATPV